MRFVGDYFLLYITYQWYYSSKTVLLYMSACMQALYVISACMAADGYNLQEHKEQYTRVIAAQLLYRTSSATTVRLHAATAVTVAQHLVDE
jgi:hypothetical protein